ncbi:sigma-70 family RNA polymerase sigma factor [Kribbella soli]|uniref:Sigma-70 family RNA polymerase sigma factor n=1 Tax=Kribbella soli TaxID=1124743 RepID=A0A4V2LYE9_9ACTN|nr:sigma-70 family RNA polymerase sigma factor [Kribbella soli]
MNPPRTASLSRERIPEIHSPPSIPDGIPAPGPAASGQTPEDFAVLFDLHAPAIHRYIARRLGTGEADDLVAQTFLIAFERRDSYRESPSGPLPWLYGIATNLIRRRRRDEIRQYRAYSRSDPGAAPAGADTLSAEVVDRVDAETTSRALAGVLAGLRQTDRDVLLLYAWEDLSYPEIAAALKIPAGTVASRLHRARRVLRAALGSDFQENRS